jgi:thymidylate synthase (FAD)
MISSPEPCLEFSGLLLHCSGIKNFVFDDPEFFIPEQWRSRPENSKQGSGEEIIIYNIESTMQFVKQTYQNLLKANVAPEMARMVLPQNMYTEWYWSGSLMAFARVCNLRCKDDTQFETQHIADCIDWHLHSKFPISWEALRDFD